METIKPYLTSQDITGIEDDPYKPFKVDIGEAFKQTPTTIPEKKPVSTNIPKVDISVQSDQPTEPPVQQEPSQPAGEGFKLPDVTLKVPDVSVDIPSVNIDPFVDATKRAADEFTYYVDKVSQPIIDNIDQSARASIEGVKQAGQTIIETAQPIVEPIKPMIKETGKAIGGTYEYLKDRVEDVMPAIDLKGVLPEFNVDFQPHFDKLFNDYGISTGLEDSSVRKGDGTGYGEVVLGDSGYVIDSSKVVDQAYNGATKGTILEGTSGRDIYDAVLDPRSFIENKAEDEASNLLSKAGIENAGDIINAVKNPESFSKEAATDFISNSTGIDNSVVGVGLEALASGDLNKAVQKAGEQALKDAGTNIATNVIKTGLNMVVPGLGEVVGFIAQIFRYSCYLSTGTYMQGLITRDQYFTFTRYRIDVQAKEPLAQQVWIGYQLAFEPVMKLMIKSKPFAKFINGLWIQPWYRYIVNERMGKKIGTGDYLVTKSIKAISLITYYVLYPKSRLVSKNSRNADVLGTYKTIIRLKEGCYA